MTPSFISLSALVSYFSLVGTTSQTGWFCGWNLYGGPNSAVNSVALSNNSFGHRNKLLTGQLYQSGAGNGSFVNAMYNSLLTPMNSTWSDDEGVATYGNYVNYVDPMLTTSQWIPGYWSTQYARLAALKGVYDPTNLFRNPQSIFVLSLVNSTMTPTPSAPSVTITTTDIGGGVRTTTEVGSIPISTATTMSTTSVGETTRADPVTRTTVITSGGVTITAVVTMAPPMTSSRTANAGGSSAVAAVTSRSAARALGVDVALSIAVVICSITYLWWRNS